AVAVGFGKFTGYLIPSLGEDNILVGPMNLGFITNFKITAAQLTGLATVILLTYINTRGVKNAKWIQFIFTNAKILAMGALVLFGFFLFKDGSIWQNNWDAAWFAKRIGGDTDVITHESLSTSTLVISICIAMVGALFSSDAWNNVT